MKGLKCHFFLSLALSLLLACIFTSKAASAYDILSSGTSELTNGQLKMWYSNPGNPETYPMNAMYIGNNFRLFRYSASPSPSDFRVQEIIGRTSMTYAQPTIAHLMIRFSRGTGAANSSVPTGFEGLRGANNQVVMSRNCIPIEEYDSGNTSYVSFYQCDYWLYTPANSQTYNLKGEIWFPSQADWIIDLYGYVDSIVLADPLSSSDIESLGSTITDALEDLQVSVESAGGATPAQIQSAVESAIASSGVVAAQNATTNAVRAQTQQQHEDYENEVDREEAKEDELNEQKDDLNISAQNPGNPFANLFNVSGCVSLPVFSQWFHQDHVTQVCSPYPEQTRPVIEFVSSVIVIGLLIQIYFKNFKGGYAS